MEQTPAENKERNVRLPQPQKVKQDSAKDKGKAEQK